MMNGVLILWRSGSAVFDGFSRKGAACDTVRFGAAISWGNAIFAFDHRRYALSRIRGCGISIC
jgi:hypothetical protein